MTLEEIFKTNPELLNAPEVQKLIAHVEEQQKKQFAQWQKKQSFYDFTMSQIWHSETCVIGGRTNAETIGKILEFDNQ